MRLYFWQDIPGTQSILAMVLIVGSGIYIIERETFSERKQILSILKIIPKICNCSGYQSQPSHRWQATQANFLRNHPI